MSAVLAATQPQATSALQQPTRTLNPNALAALGVLLSGRFTQYESDRRMAELKWTKNARQFLGVYDPDIDQSISPTRSRAYPKLTRVKCVSMLSRLMNLLFPAGDKNWGVACSAVPNLSQEDLQPILDALMPTGGEVPSDEKIEAAILAFAKVRAERLELEIEDQLQELGGNRAQDYVALCRKVLMSGIQYGAGVLRGPFVEEQKLRKWQVANGRLTAVEVTAYRPRFEFTSLWDYYPDMSAKSFKSMDGQFLRQVMSRHQFMKLKDRSDFFPDQIDKALGLHPGGNYKRKAHETELRALGPQLNSQSGESNKFEAIVWDGYVSGKELADCGVLVPVEKLTQDVYACVWMVGNTIIKAEVNPWSTLLPAGVDMQCYHQFVFEEDESFLLGNGLPNIMRDSQMGMCAAVRMTLDNASVQRVFEVNYSLLRPDADITAITPDMMIPRDDDTPATLQYPAVRAVELPMNIDKMMAMVNMFQGFADSETFVNPATGGDMQKGPSEPFRTAAGASMLRGDAALPFKDVVRNFDSFTESVIGSLIWFNLKFNTNPNIKGDFTALARGATTLIAKEVQGMQLDNIAQTLTDEEKRYLNPRGLLRARLKVRDMDVADIVYDDERCDQIDQDIAQQQQDAQAQASKLAEATVRKTLSDVLKNIAQANKNAAGAEVAVANMMLDALERGLNPDMLVSRNPPKTEGMPDGKSATGGSPPGGAALGPGAGEQQRSGLDGLEAATGDAAASPRPRAAAMPTQ